MDFFSALPEGCISDILSRTSPRDGCRSSAISKGFKSVADSDSVWGGFLPSDYRKIITRSVSPVAFSTKKQLFFRLANYPILLDDGNLSFGLDKESGKKCFVIGARQLSFKWANTTGYWKWISLPESRFSEVVEVLAAHWFEFWGNIDTLLLSPGTTYIAYLVFKIAHRNLMLESHPFKASIVLMGKNGEWMGNWITSTIYFKMGESGRDLSAQKARFAYTRKDGWMEIELGEFFNCYGDSDDDMDMHVEDIYGGFNKSGLIVEGIELRPKCQNKLLLVD